MLKAIIAVCAATIIGCADRSSTTDNILESSGDWPLIEEKYSDFPVNFESGTPLIRFDINRRDSGTPLYRLLCFSGDQGIDTVWSGGLLCAIGSADMSDDQIFGRSYFSTSRFNFRAIYSRGNFNHEDIQGICAEHPFYGRSRVFRFRGMLITLELSDVQLGQTRRGDSEPPKFVVNQAMLDVWVRSDPSSTLSAEDDIPFAPPNGDAGECQRQIEAISR
jgi:hypothetical protein